MSFEDNWQAGEQPLADNIGEATGGFDFWQAGEQPPVWFGGGNGNGGDEDMDYSYLFTGRHCRARRVGCYRGRGLR